MEILHGIRTVITEHIVGAPVYEIIGRNIRMVLVIGGNIQQRLVDLGVVYIFGIHQLLCSGIIIEGQQNAFGSIIHVFKTGMDDANIIYAFVYKGLPHEGCKGCKQGKSSDDNTDH